MVVPDANESYEMPKRVYTRRRNRDGSWESICPICFQTVSIQKNEHDLTLPEAAHACDPDVLRRLFGKSH